MKLDAKKLRALLESRGLTNTRLAHLSGISRQAVQAMLREDRVVEVRERTVKGIAKALRLPDESMLSPDPLSGYKEAIADEYADLTFRGLALPTAQPRSMDQLYVQIRLRRVRERDCEPSEDKSDSKAPTRIDEPMRETESFTFDECTRLHHRVLIRGEPGSGKTTALRHAARMHARQGVTGKRDIEQPKLPVLVRLADYCRARETNPDITPVRFVVVQMLRDATPEYSAQVERELEQKLVGGECLVLFDGLDELGSDNVRHVSGLREFINKYGGNRFVITSRSVGLDSVPWKELGFNTFEIARWGEDEIREFVTRWYEGRSPSRRKQSKEEAQEQAEKLTAAILGPGPLREIASNPLMLTILAQLQHATTVLPRRRVELYAKIVEVMLEYWEASKREARPGDALHGIVLEAREFGWLLARLALAMQREGRVLKARWWVNDIVQQFLRQEMALNGDQVKEQTERIIRYLCERAGLLVERGDRVFGFSHRTFQEYFAARGLLLEIDGGGDIVKSLKPYVFHPQWEEVVVHVAASLAAHSATAVVRTILDDPDPAGRFLRRGQRLALRCLVDGAVVADRSVLEQVFSDGTSIGQSRWLGVTIALNSLLKQLFNTKYDADARRMFADIEEGMRSLPEHEYLSVHLACDGPPKGAHGKPPGTVCARQIGRLRVNLIWPAWDMRLTNPDKWLGEISKQLRDTKVETGRKTKLISYLGEEADSDPKVPNELIRLLVDDPLPKIRIACAEAIAEAELTNPSVVDLLLERLNKEKSDEVRERCAWALRATAPTLAKVRIRLEKLFASGPERVRAGAARGLSAINLTSPDQQELLNRFLAAISNTTEPNRVRFACIWAIASAIGEDDSARISDVVEATLDDPDPQIRKAALHVLADVIAEGRRSWPAEMVQKVESQLMAVADPCPHLFGDLARIVALRESRGGSQMQQLVLDALAPFEKQITIAFVFGSVARLEQIRESDIDLMIIGELRLKELAMALQSPERTLGRPINPVIYLPEKFREQYREGNPFLLDVVRKEKVFVKGSNDELARLVADGSSD